MTVGESARMHLEFGIVNFNLWPSLEARTSSNYTIAPVGPDCTNRLTGMAHLRPLRKGDRMTILPHLSVPNHSVPFPLLCDPLHLPADNKASCSKANMHVLLLHARQIERDRQLHALQFAVVHHQIIRLTFFPSGDSLISTLHLQPLGTHHLRRQRGRPPYLDFLFGTFFRGGGSATIVSSSDFTFEGDAANSFDFADKTASQTVSSESSPGGDGSPKSSSGMSSGVSGESGVCGLCIFPPTLVGEVSGETIVRSRPGVGVLSSSRSKTSSELRDFLGGVECISSE